MPLIHRKIGDGTTSVKKYESCGVCYFCPYDCTNYSAPPPPPPTAAHHQFPAVLILMITGLALVVLLFSCLVFFRYRSILRNSWRMNPSRPVLGNGGLYENQAGPVMDHHVWYIRTVGLPQSLIDSIPIFDYRRGEKMVEGSDDHCAVCLSEFQDNESLRLLPKCSHAFHVVCIDTWLRSHKSCPVCRSPVSMDSRNASVATGSDHSGSIQGPELETHETADARAVHQNGGESGVGSEKRALRVLSDLSDRRAVEVDGRESERVRRSVSMDYSSDEIQDDKSDEGCSETRLSMSVNTRI